MTDTSTYWPLATAHNWAILGGSGQALATVTQPAEQSDESTGAVGRWVPILAPSLVRGSDTSGDACESLLGVAHLLAPARPLRLTDPVTLGCLLPWKAKGVGKDSGFSVGIFLKN